jgi:tetratricopeptide (TPR) repeat protein
MRMKALILCCSILLLFSACKRGAQSTTEVPSGSNGTGVKTSAPGEARALLEKGKQLYREDQDSAASEAFQQAIALDPDLAEAHFRLGLTFETLNKAEEAEAEYKKAVDGYKKYLNDHPDDFEARYNLGQTYASLNRYSDAIREYRQAIKLKDDDAQMYFDLGMALTRLAQYAEAVSAFSKSLEIDPDNYRAEDALAEAREGVKRIKMGKKHQEDLLKKQKEKELKKGTSGLPGVGAAKPTPTKNP